MKESCERINCRMDERREFRVWKHAHIAVREFSVFGVLLIVIL